MCPLPSTLLERTWFGSVGALCAIPSDVNSGSAWPQKLSVHSRIFVGVTTDFHSRVIKDQGRGVLPVFAIYFAAYRNCFQAQC